MLVNDSCELLSSYQISMILVAGVRCNYYIRIDTLSNLDTIGRPSKFSVVGTYLRLRKTEAESAHLEDAGELLHLLKVNAIHNVSGRTSDGESSCRAPKDSSVCKYRTVGRYVQHSDKMRQHPAIATH